MAADRSAEDPEDLVEETWVATIDLSLFRSPSAVSELHVAADIKALIECDLLHEINGFDRGWEPYDINVDGRRA